MTINKKVVALVTLLAIALVLPLRSLSGAEKKDTVVLTKSNTIILAGEVGGETASIVLSKSKELNKGSGPIYMFMNTPGGSIQTGLEMIEALNCNNRKINTVTLFAASMGFQIVQNLGERLILRNGTLMSHRAAGGIEGYFGGQRPSQLDSRYNFWLSRLNELDEQVVKRTNGKQTLASYQKAYADELWLTGEQAVAGGYADRVVTVKCDSSLDGVTSHSVEFFGIRISYDLDNCPINTSPMNVRVSMPEQKKNLTPEQTRAIEVKFTEQFIMKQKSVIPMQAW